MADAEVALQGLAAILCLMLEWYHTFQRTALHKRQNLAAVAEGLAVSCCSCHLPHPSLNLSY